MDGPVVLRALWRHLVNTIELLLPSANPSPQSKWQLDRFSRSWTAHDRKSVYFSMNASFPQNCTFPRAIRTSV